MLVTTQPSSRWSQINRLESREDGLLTERLCGPHGAAASYFKVGTFASGPHGFMFSHRVPQMSGLSWVELGLCLPMHDRHEMLLPPVSSLAVVAGCSRRAEDRETSFHRSQVMKNCTQDTRELVPSILHWCISLLYSPHCKTYVPLRRVCPSLMEPKGSEDRRKDSHP